MTVYSGRFAGRTAIITGGASGLGRETAGRIVAEGGQVALWDINAEHLEEAKSAIGAIHTVALDVSDYAQVAKAAQST
ncbi:MAG: 3-oxoacyl-[acyl-carrier protein] reductase, partial [Phenylobacterium sp.]|nr:3-oxoacyl-[acyl-carrier protein] reductase [Phenylobacterium sp.]